MVAGPAHAEKALLEADLAGAAAGGACLGFGARLGAAPAATVATLGVRDLYLVFNAEGRLFKGDLHIVLEVVAASAMAALPAAAEDVAKYVAENVAERRTRAETSAGKAAPPHPGMAELIVLRPFLRIGEDFVRLGDLLEPFFRRMVSGVLVGVVLNGQLAECLLYLGFRGIPMDFQDFVVIAFFTVCQNKNPFGQKAKGKNAGSWQKAKG
jgi:hypothetical protein